VLDQTTTKIGKLREQLTALLREHERDGALPTSGRFLFYELVQHGVISKERPTPTNGKIGRRPDQDMTDALTDIRESGIIPWDWIVDETRSVDDCTGYGSVKDGVLAQLPYIKLDPWQGNKPMVLTESRSLAGVLRPIVDEYRARIASTNGQCGGFLRTEIAPRLKPGDRVLYFGDLDLAGGQIEENTRRVLEREIGGALRWERVALTEKQRIQYRLPVITKHDKRYKDGRPHQAVETEALQQTTLIRILRTRLNQLIPVPLEDVQEREARQRGEIERLLTLH
jgi:hypothetical protein